MLSDFEMIVHQFKGGHDIVIYPVADVHLGSPECREQEFIKFINSVAETPNAYICLLGDLIDNGTKSSVTNPFRATMPPSQQKREMANILAPARDKILFITPGNHERRSMKDADDDPCYDIASKLDLEHLYRENICFAKIQLGEGGHETAGRSRPTYVIVATHGAGGGIMTGGSVNRNERFGYAIDGMDVLVTGHTHKPLTTQPGKIVIDPRNNNVSIRPFKTVVVTSWLDYGSYATRMMLLPSSFCPNKITLAGDHKEITVTM